MPLFIWITGFVLFVSLAFFAFAQAAVARNGAQSAADAAALAAAQDARGELMEKLLLSVQDGDGDWGDWLSVDQMVGATAEEAAGRLAAANDAQVTAFRGTEVRGKDGYVVEVRSVDPVGDSVLPMTSGTYASAAATAVIEPLCEPDSESDPLERISFSCDDGTVVDVDADDFEMSDLPDPATLFSVYLAN
ncbi:pilus assembly protein TadG-related protein [Streptomyces koyangensis]